MNECAGKQACIYICGKIHRSCMLVPGFGFLCAPVCPPWVPSWRRGSVVGQESHQSSRFAEGRRGERIFLKWLALDRPCTMLAEESRAVEMREGQGDRAEPGRRAGLRIPEPVALLAGKVGLPAKLCPDTRGWLHPKGALFFSFFFKGLQNT